MDTKAIFLIFGIGLACYAVIIGLSGLRFKNFPSQRALVGLLLLGAFLVVGTGTFAVKLQIKEANERKEKAAESAKQTSVVPPRAPINA